jgi:hypothetical protein
MTLNNISKCLITNKLINPTYLFK